MVRMGERASRFTILVMFSSMLVANLFVMGKAISGEPIRIKGFETKEEGRRTLSRLYEIDSYDKLKQEFLDSFKPSTKSEEEIQREIEVISEKESATKIKEDDETFYVKIKK
ncbi:predicted protein [Naegleria gruberi]|uniref:Predicted protein n=1 Tax=Naegleria gruberi TaxID=5762 RepID=D2VUN9_NAEGR|nr:uncharacterized protein NAEGRDRAFT_72731 [Naegleria gruberi]EFC39486.1 predicted protein [Naegleria gruberi]|eukprot:XP_002672230.1 predicted protein [Naegleria gruberi strain NEG-M]